MAYERRREGKGQVGIPAGALASPWAECERWVNEYERHGTLEPIELGRMITAVGEIVREHKDLTMAMLQLERVWPQVRQSLNEVRRTTSGHVGGAGRGSRDRRPGRADPFGGG